MVTSSRGRVAGVVLAAVFLAVLLLGPAAAKRPGPVVVRTLAGRTLRVGEEPRVALLVFGARWCRPCEELVPGLRRLRAVPRTRRLTVILVGLPVREDADGFSRWARDAGFEGPLAFDRERRLLRLLGVREVPALVAVGPGGRILWRGDRVPELAEVESWLAAGNR